MRGLWSVLTLANLRSQIAMESWYTLFFLPYVYARPAMRYCVMYFWCENVQPLIYITMITMP